MPSTYQSGEHDAHARTTKRGSAELRAMLCEAAHHASRPYAPRSFDRMLFRGYLPLMSGFAMADFLRSKQVDRWKLKPFLLERKCLQLYYYFMDRQLGLIHVEVQTWWPFT